jgi:Bacterial Ig-like domain (group 1)
VPALRGLPAAAALFLAAACNTDSGLTPTPVTVRFFPAAIAVVSGNDQNGKAGEPLADPLVVRVTDANGAGVNNIAVSFRITSGAGVLGGPCDGRDPGLARSSHTDPDGIARMAFHPTVLGRSTITARVDALRDVSITFTAEATVLVIDFWFGYWNVGFVGPCSNSSDVTVPMGSTVEWKVPVQDDRYPIAYTVTSTSTPPGAKGFDSGLLTSHDRFRFVPPVSGTWEYRDRVTGLTGTLSVK